MSDDMRSQLQQQRDDRAEMLARARQHADDLMGTETGDTWSARARSLGVEIARLDATLRRLDGAG